MAAMNYAPQPPPPPPPYAGGYPPPPPPPADPRIKRGVRRGEAFADPVDAARAVAYAESFLKGGSDLSRPPILGAIALGFVFAVVLQIAVGNWFVVFVPVAVFIGMLGYLTYYAINKGRVEQALAANRQVLGR
jgi:hypothetical protein